LANSDTSSPGFSACAGVDNIDVLNLTLANTMARTRLAFHLGGVFGAAQVQFRPRAMGTAILSANFFKHLNQFLIVFCALASAMILPRAFVEN
jgi:hypothetical protein